MGPRPISTTRDMDKTRDQLLKELQDLRDRLAGMRDGEESCSRLAAIVDSSDDAIIGKALDGTITCWNKSAERLYGYSEAEAVGEPIGIIVPPDRTRELEWILSKIRRGGRVEHHETVRATKDGRRLDVSVTISPIFDPAGRIVGASTIARDITERKRAEEELRKAHDELEVMVEQRTSSLRETRDYLESLLDYANAPIIVWDPSFNITRFNHAFERLSGYGAGEVVGKNLRVLFPPGSVKESLEKIRGTLGGERWESVEVPILRKDGSVRIALWNSANVNDEKGELLATIAQGQDITERKRMEEALLEKQEELKAQAEELEAQAEELEAQAEELRVNNEELERQIEERRQAEESLRESEEKFRILADFTYDWVVWSGPVGNNVYISPSCERITGHKADEFYDDPGLLNRIVHPDDMKAFGQHMDTHLRNASICGNFDFRIISTRGETHWINHVCQPVFRDNGEWLGRRASNRDITERKKAEAELIKKNDDLAALNGKLRELSQAVEQSPATVVITDTKGNIEYVNPKFTELTGYSFEEAIGNNPRILKTGETTPEEYKRIWETITSGKDWHGVFHNKKKNGDLYWESAIISPIMDDSGKITNFIAVKEDITERKRMEDALRESEEWFHAVADNIPVLVWMADADGRIFWFNKQYYDYTGMTLEELRGRGWEKVIHPDYVESATELWRSMIKTGQPRDNIFPLRGKDGSYRWSLARSRPIRNEDGAIIRWFGSHTDITERKQAEEALLVSEERLRRASSAGRIGLFERNEDQNTVYLSPEAYELYGFNQGSRGAYETWLARVHPEDREVVERSLAENREKARHEPGFSAQYEFRVVHSDGAVLWLEVQSTYALEDGELIVRGVVRDITGRKRAEKELEDYRKHLEDLVQERTRKLDEEKRQADLYVDLMGHDISNINQAGMGNLELLQIMGKLDAQGQKQVSTALKAFEKSSELIKNVKKLQKVKKGELHLEKIDVGRILNIVKKDYQTVPGRDITISLSSPEGCFVHADGLLYDVFSNIVDNSIKYSSGPVDINISLSIVEMDDKIFYRVSIEDDGPGIKPDLKKRIFNRMYYEGGIMRGKGLGLYLVKTLVEYFHGTISVEDRIPGDHTKGARFVVTLPVA